MAVENRRFVVCDIDKTDGAEEGIRFGIDGKNYLIDMMPHHAEELRGFLAKYIEHAREDKGTNQTSPQPVKQASRKVNEKHQRVRAWAKDTGRDVPHGQIPKSLIAEYDAAHAEMGMAA